MARNSRMWWGLGAGGAVLILIALAFWLLNPASDPPIPAADPFVQSYKFTRRDDGTPIPDVLVLPAGKGIYADIELVPQDPHPEEFDGTAVVDPDFWVISLVVYPQGDRRSGESTMTLICLDYKRGLAARLPPKSPGTHRRKVPHGSVGYWWKTRGFDGAPPPPKASSTPAIRKWTFIDVPDRPPGEYVFELTLHPCAQWLSSVRFIMGSPVIIQRGLLQVPPAD